MTAGIPQRQPTLAVDVRGPTTLRFGHASNAAPSAAWPAEHTSPARRCSFTRRPQKVHLMNTVKHDQDFYAWTQQQADLLKHGRSAELDIEHLSEELESMGASDKRELMSRLTVLLAHLLKWRAQCRLPKPRRCRAGFLREALATPRIQLLK